MTEEEKKPGRRHFLGSDSKGWLEKPTLRAAAASFIVLMGYLTENFLWAPLPNVVSVVLTLAALIYHLYLAVTSRSLRVAVTAAGTLSAANLISILTAREQELPLAFAIFAITGSFWVFMLLMVIHGSAALGTSFLEVQKAQKRIKNASRHERIGRLLELRDRLHLAQIENAERAETTAKFIQRHPYEMAVLAIVLPSLLTWFLMRRYDPDGALLLNLGNTTLTEEEARLVAAMSLVGLLQQLLTAIAGYAAKTWKTFIYSSLVFVALFLAFSYAPFSPSAKLQHTPDGVMRTMFSLVVTLFVMTLGCLAAQVQAWAERNRLLHRNDASILIEEIQALEEGLVNQRELRCVMVVDVAGSTRMKANADPLVCEWTFREYQHLIAREAIRYGGTVVSTAGDGAVLSFDQPEECFRAARSIQAALQTFNLEVNRLPDWFQIRIGMHQGEITGTVGEVQFTEIIDIAAHIEEQTPVGEIGMSEQFASSLPVEWSNSSHLAADGRTLFLARAEAGV